MLLPQVKAALRLVGFVLFLPFWWEWYSWSWAFFYAFDSWWSAIPAGFVFAAMILVFDRYLAVMDTTRRQEREVGITIGRFRLPITGAMSGYAMRFMILMGLSFVTSIPVELRAFRSEIDDKIAQLEGQSLNRIRDAAKREERETYAQRIEEARSHGRGDLTELRAELRARREAMATRHEAGRAQRREALNTAENAARGELHGEISGRQGAGERYRALQEDVAHQRELLADYEATCAREIESLNSEEQRTLARRRTNQEAEVARLEAEREERLRWVDSATPEAVARRYRAQGQWRVSRGLMGRVDILTEIMHERPTRFWVAWTFRTAMLALGLMVMAIKALSDEAFEAYFSVRMQARNGNPDAQRLLASRGIVDFEAFARDPHLRDLDAEWLEACRNTDAILREFSIFLFDLAHERDGKGRLLSFSVIRSRLERKFLEIVEPSRSELFRRAEVLRSLGVREPEWPSELNGGQDPRDPRFKPFGIGKAELASRFDWIDPEPQLEAIRAAQRRWVELRDQLLRNVALADEALARYVRDGLTFQQILHHRSATWRVLQELLAKMEDVEREIRDGKEEIPSWPAYSPDPRSTLRARMILELTRERLTDLGWSDPEVVTANVAPPPPLPRLSPYSCGRCGTVNEWRFRFCTSCGKDRDETHDVISADTMIDAEPHGADTDGAHVSSDSGASPSQPPEAAN